MSNPATAWQLAVATAQASHETSRRMFFFAEELPEGARNIRRVYTSVKKHGVILDGDAPWEQGGGVASFAGSVVRLDDGRYRLYYTVTPRGGMRMAVAESDDGLSWQRLALGQERWRGQDTNRIVLTGVPGAENARFASGEAADPDGRPVVRDGEAGRQGMVGQPQVLRQPDGSWRMYYWHHQSGWGRIPYVFAVAESRDGLQWHVPCYDQPVLNSHWMGNQSGISKEQSMAEKGRRTNDANFVYWNTRLGCWEQFSQWLLDAHPDRHVAEDNCPELNRMIQRRVSADGLNWNAPEIVIQADGRDPWDQQFYHLTVQYHEDWLIGSLGHYRVEHGQQTQDLELVFSRDGRRWERPLRGGFIPREPGTRDAEGVYPPNAWIDRGDRWLCLYTGTARRHSQWADDTLPRNCIMAASWPKHRFIGLRADDVPGGFMTSVFFPQCDEIRVDADVRGWLRAELCDAWGRKREGYHLQNAVPLQGDSGTHVLRWRERDSAGFCHEPVRLRFECADADVYGVWW